MVRTGPAVERILATSPKTPLLTIANMTANFIGQHDIYCLPLEQLTPALLWATTRYLSEKIRADGQLDINRELTKDLAAAQHDLFIARGNAHGEAERLRRLAEHSLIGIWHQNADGGTVFLNSRARQFSRYRKQRPRRTTGWRPLYCPGNGGGWPARDRLG